MTRALWAVLLPLIPAAPAAAQADPAGAARIDVAKDGASAGTTSDESDVSQAGQSAPAAAGSLLPGVVPIAAVGGAAGPGVKFRLLYGTPASLAAPPAGGGRGAVRLGAGGHAGAPSGFAGDAADIAIRLPGGAGIPISDSAVLGLEYRYFRFQPKSGAGPAAAGMNRIGVTVRVPF